MNELLFENNIEKEALENLLALNQIKKCDAEIDKYTDEINEQNNTMMSILKDEDIDEEYVEKIHKYKKLLNKMNGDNGRVDELNKLIAENESRINEFQNKINEVDNKLEQLKNEIFETSDPSKVIECQNEIENNNVRLNDLNEILNQLISDNTPLLIEKEYLTAKNSDHDFNIPNYNKAEINKDLDKITKDFNEAIAKLDLPIRENIEFCQKKINNREKEIEKFISRKNEVIEKYPNSIKLDVDKAYDDISNLLSELELSKTSVEIYQTNIFDEEDLETKNLETENSVKEKEESKQDNTDIKSEMSFLDEDNIDKISETKQTIEDKVNGEEQIQTEEMKEVTNAPSSIDLIEEENSIPKIEETQTDSNENEIKEEKEEVSQSESEEEIASVTYVLSDGESLMNIADKVYPSKDNWQAIYYFNKDILDKYLISNGISNDFDTIKELANDTSLFTGIKLEIPTDYNFKK